VQRPFPYHGMGVVFVSILTGLERPVQLGEVDPSVAVKFRVSILTGLERPVQRAQHPEAGPSPGGFNPHRP